jgi:hypothetical protein
LSEANWTPSEARSRRCSSKGSGLMRGLGNLLTF